MDGSKATENHRHEVDEQPEAIDDRSDRVSYRSQNTEEETGNEALRLSRRTMLQLTGAVASTSVLGIGSTPSVAARTGINEDFLNWRVREASKVWDRGYRGRPDRSIALTDSGLESRHPDEGPWNGITALIRDGAVKLTRPANNDTERVKTDETESITGTAEPGSFATGDEIYHPFVTPADVEQLDTTLTWNPPEPANDLELGIDKLIDGEYKRVATAATGNTPETVSIDVEPEHEYRFVVELYLNVACTYEISGTYYNILGDISFVNENEVFDFSGSSGDIALNTPKTVGWYDAGSRYGSHRVPRDGDGHGSHVAGIMGGSGRASTLDPDAFQEHEPHAILAAGDFLEYDVEASANTGVFGSAYGTLIELVVEGPNGNVLDSTATSSDGSRIDNAIVEAPTIHDSGMATYTVSVRPAGGQAASSAQVERVGLGPFLDPEATTGDRTENGPRSLHGGIAPNQSLVGFQGLSDPTTDLGAHADEFARIFNIRAVNMSWGYTGGLPIGAAGGALGTIPATVRDIAEGGILTCAAAGNSATPLNGNGAPAVADEAISVAATGNLDGIAGYSSGGVGAIDEDKGGEYMKPDVTAPGGTLTDLIDAVLRGDPNTSESEQKPIREYTLKAGTSMAAPFATGTAGLIAEAMEFDAPVGIALPEPAAADIDAVLRLKQVLLATASETVFTAAPYHRAHVPSYEFGGRDPYEGFGRLNPDAAADAVTRELSGTTAETVGLNLPEDSRAVAGYVTASSGTFTATIDFDHYSGGNKGQTNGQPPQIDLFIYDAETPAPHGDPNVVARSTTLNSGTTTASASFGRNAEDSVYYVVAKLTNVPGAVNGDDVQAHFDLSVSFDSGVFVSGTRSDDGSVFTAGQTDEMSLTVNPSESGLVRDAVPTEWDVLTDASDDIDRIEQTNGVKYVYFTKTAAADMKNEYTYLVEAPEKGSAVSDTGQYTFGPVELQINDEWIAVNGTSENNTVVGLSTDL
ncbi:S8 family peptidase [Halocatena marina]|uniref:S8 family peptidase n=1 Tax=Halocatena marina TaxID=2934937 RepID=UPI002010094F|nr:S8 family serine peptidase [Halocatena marina]